MFNKISTLASKIELLTFYVSSAIDNSGHLESEESIHVLAVLTECAEQLKSLEE